MRSGIQSAGTVRLVAGVGVAAVAAVIACAAVAVMPSSAVAQASDSLSIESAVTRALQSHPSPEAARAAMEAATASRREARAAYWPTLHVQGSATRFEDPALVIPLHGLNPAKPPIFDETVFHGSLVAGWTVFDGGARGARTDHADAIAGSAAASFDATSQALVARTLAAYLEVRTRDEVARAQDQRLDALAAERDRVGRRLEAGRAARLELLRVEAAVARAEAERVQNREAANVAAAELTRLVGATSLPPLRAVTLADSTVPTSDDLVRRALEHNPQTRRATAQERAAIAAASVARAARWPELQARGAYQGWADDNGHEGLEWNVGLLLYYPIFTGGATQSAVQRADAEHRGAVASLEETALQVAQEVDRALAGIAESRARVRSFAVAADRTAEVARIEALALEAGSGTQTDWLLAEATLLEARAELAEARHSEIAARAHLARITGDLDADWIARTLETLP